MRMALPVSLNVIHRPPKTHSPQIKTSETETMRMLKLKRESLRRRRKIGWARLADTDSHPLYCFTSRYQLLMLELSSFLFVSNVPDLPPPHNPSGPRAYVLTFHNQKTTRQGSIFLLIAYNYCSLQLKIKT